MQFFKSTLFVAIVAAASFVAAAPAQSECIPLVSKLECIYDNDCCSNLCISSITTYNLSHTNKRTIAGQEFEPGLWTSASPALHRRSRLFRSNTNLVQQILRDISAAESYRA
ncbi:hypothetical protein FIBSPDRAFT_891193 [Athelia psychrophila]|uniref:Uncharacterized protein n=1 Tax=Athelia psychrophila TaxID=1759441 RepID=A0A166K3K3_9AGAM|nr:hypothetical protein FIBSPDRAFT_891193 [Fibularhizoctonia sp. CBS 109695]